MLHEDVLLLLYHFAATCKGTILEIGPYVGGSTVVLGRAAKRYGRSNVLSIEVGGRHNHPDIPSDNIFEDLRRNVTRFGVADTITLLHGFSNSPDVIEAVVRQTGSSGLDLLFIDADGHVGRDFEIYRHLLNNGALLVFDDYCAPQAKEKASLVQDWVDTAVQEHKVKSLGVWGWGTWVGVY